MTDLESTLAAISGHRVRAHRAAPAHPRISEAAMTAPARRPVRDLPLLVFTAVVLLCMLCVPASREWMWDKFTDITLNTLGWIGADIGPLTQ